MHLGEDRVFLAGHSGGGHQVLAYGIEHSEHVRGIVAVDAIVDAGHLPWIEQPRAFTAACDAWFASLEPALTVG